MYIKQSIKYSIAFLGTIILGLLSRKVSGIPTITGDVLYAIMAYWMFRIILLNKSPKFALLLAIIICFGIEILQLVQIEPLIWARNNSFFRLILGQGFLWSDLIAYLCGSFIAYSLDKFFCSKRLTSNL